MYLNTGLPAVQVSALQEHPGKTQIRLLQVQQQHPQQQQQQQRNDNQRNQRNQQQHHHQQHHHQQMEVYAQSRMEQLSVERASDFAAQLASFLWFRDVQAQHHHHHHYDLCRYAFNESRARGSFRKFCREVISATQVSTSVIALSLLYINRMKRQSIQGHPGSEFRAFTVALMLANKFLDDNTYTNKTWSEVTNIPVREINIMEMEFIHALDFTLYVSLQEYYEWVYWLDQFVDAVNGSNGHNDDGSVPDCSSPIQLGSFGSTTLQQQQQQQQVQIVPQLTVDTTPPAVGYKRSAEQAFDAMVTSPPKRTNSADGSHPVYPQKVVTPGPSSQQPLILHHHHQQQQPRYQPQQQQPRYQPRQARPQPLYQLAYIENASALFGVPAMTSAPSVAYATSGSTAYVQPQYTFNVYPKRMSYISRPAAIQMTSFIPTTVV